MLVPSPEDLASRLAAIGCRLRRAWPDDGGALALEVLDERGAVRAGSWRRAAAHPRISGGAGVIVVRATAHDGRLPRLAAAACVGTRIIGHRSGRRAVLEDLVDDTVVKVVRPRAVARLLTTLDRARRVFAEDGAGPGTHAPACHLPEVIASHPDGVVRLSRVPGRPLLGGTAPSRDTWRRLGAIVRHLHDSPPEPSEAAHGPEDEVRTLERWLGHLHAVRPDLHARAMAHAQHTRSALLDEPGPTGLLHRDLHDGQVLVDSNGALGLLDFDTLARGERALDLANLLVHLELAVVEGRLPERELAPAGAALLAGYDACPAVRRRIAPHMNATRLRLVAVHAYRPGGSGRTEVILRRLGDLSGPTVQA